MKRICMICLCLIPLLWAEAQTFNYTGIEIKNERVKKQHVYEKEHFVMLNYGLDLLGESFGIGSSGNKSHAFGATYGQVKLLGWYAGFLLGTGMHYGYDLEITNGVRPFYTGAISQNQLAFYAGGIVRLVIPLYLYIGTGYGYNSRTAQITSGEWVKCGNYNPHCQEWEAGWQASIKGFTINAGIYLFTNYTNISTMGMKFGLGWTFKSKKKE